MPDWNGGPPPDTKGYKIGLGLFILAAIALLVIGLIQSGGE